MADFRRDGEAEPYLGVRRQTSDVRLVKSREPNTRSLRSRSHDK